MIYEQGNVLTTALKTAGVRNFEAISHQVTESGLGTLDSLGEVAVGILADAWGDGILQSLVLLEGAIQTLVSKARLVTQIREIRELYQCILNLSPQVSALELDVSLFRRWYRSVGFAAPENTLSPINAALSSLSEKEKRAYDYLRIHEDRLAASRNNTISITIAAVAVLVALLPYGGAIVSALVSLIVRFLRLCLCVWLN